MMLPDPKKRKIGSKTSDCLFIGYAEHSVAFLVLKKDMMSVTTSWRLRMSNSLRAFSL